mmetsp:Transcript_2903/g.7843  ORF Transcript_2903/g.7843 Transcript_2903/m.7843 type:complete len:208 (+) Transcript_2903:20-643(+)
MVKGQEAPHHCQARSAARPSREVVDYLGDGPAVDAGPRLLAVGARGVRVDPGDVPRPGLHGGLHLVDRAPVLAVGPLGPLHHDAALLVLQALQGLLHLLLGERPQRRLRRLGQRGRVGRGPQAVTKLDVGQEVLELTGLAAHRKLNRARALDAAPLHHLALAPLHLRARERGGAHRGRAGRPLGPLRHEAVLLHSVVRVGGAGGCRA